MHLHTLGQAVITIGASRLLPNTRLLFASALYVALEGSKSIARETLTTLFWPEENEEKATHSLRQTLYRLRAQGVPIEADAERVALASDIVTADFASLMPAEYVCPTNELLTRIPGGFMPGYFPRISQPYAEWVEGQRDRVNAALRRQLVAGIKSLRAAGDWPATQALAQRCLELDPLNEEATLAFAEAIAMDGSKARAIMIIDRYMNEIGRRAPELHQPALSLKKRIADLYPLPPVIEREPPQIGREEEMAALDAALAEARQGKGSAFLISGPPGMGKTRLVTEFTRAAQLRGIATARSQMGRHDDHRPLGAWSDIVPTLQRMSGALGCDPESLPYLKRLTTYDASQTTPSPETQDAEYLFARMRMSIIDLVSAVASESCVILLIEDVHWMDEWSWDVMSALTKRLEKVGVLILMTRRDSEEPSTAVPNDAVLRDMPLVPLDEGRCNRLIRVVPGLRDASAEFEAWCARTCSGNPYFLIELGRSASRQDGKFVAPQSLIRLVARRFSDVSPVSKRVVQVAAILGRHATMPMIERTLDERRLTLLDSLDELTTHGLIFADGTRIICRHDLLGISALEDASPSSLQLMYRNAAECLELGLNDLPSPADLWDCAQLWASAGMHAKEWVLLDRCADRALALGAHRDAARALERMSSACHIAPEVLASLHDRLVQTLYLGGEYNRVLEITETRESNDHRPSDSKHTGQELARLDALFYGQMRLPEILAHSMSCVADDSASPAHRVEAATLACKTASNLFDVAAGHLVRDLIEPSLELVPPAIAAEFTMIWEGSFGSTSLSANAARQLMGYSSASDWRPHYARLASLCGYALFLNGDVDESFRLLTEAAEHARKLELHDREWRILEYIGTLQLLLGDLPAAQAALAAADRRPTSLTLRDTRLVRERRMRLAVLQDDFLLADSEFAGACIDWTPDWPRAHTHFTALRVILEVRARGRIPTDEEVNQLVSLHLSARGLAMQDFYVYALSYVFSARNEWHRAQKLYDEYLAHRRERGPVLKQLRDRMLSRS